MGYVDEHGQQVFLDQPQQPVIYVNERGQQVLMQQPQQFYAQSPYAYAQQPFAGPFVFTPEQANAVQMGQPEVAAPAPAAGDVVAAADAAEKKSKKKSDKKSKKKS